MEWLFLILVIAVGIAAVIMAASLARSRRLQAPETDRRVDRFVERQHGPRVIHPGHTSEVNGDGDGGGGADG